MTTLIEPFYRALGQKVRTQRDRRHLTQEELGRRLSPRLTRAAVANIEGGKQRVLAHTLTQIAEVLDVELSEIVPASQRVTLLESFDIAKELVAAGVMDADAAHALARKVAVKRDTGAE